MNNDKFSVCPVIYGLNIFGKKWKLPVLCQLDKHPAIRYNELKRKIPGITDMMLSQTLKELEALGIVFRVQYNEIPPRVEYSLTDDGIHMLKTLCRVGLWGAGQLKKEEKNCGCGDACLQNFETEEQEYLVSDGEEKLIDPRITEPVKYWDEGYEKVYAEITAEALMVPKTGLEKAECFFRRANDVLTQKNAEYQKKIYMLMFGLNRLRFEDHDRPYYNYLAEFIQEGRSDGSIECPLSNDEIVHMLAVFNSGMIMKWLITEGAYELLEYNNKEIRWLFDSLKKP